MYTSTAPLSLARSAKQNVVGLYDGGIVGGWGLGSVSFVTSSVGLVY